MPVNYEALLLDLSGVIYDGTRVIQGAVAFMERARATSLVLRFVTNTATKSAATIRQDLLRMGIEIAPHELFTAPLAAKSYIEANGLRPYCLIHPEIEPDFAELPQENPNCVLLGDAREGLNYDSLNRAFRLCKQGAPLIAIRLNKYFMDDQGLMQDAGPFVRAIEWVADTEAIIMGKQEPL